MVRSCEKDGKNRTTKMVSNRKPIGKRQKRRARKRWVDNVKEHLKMRKKQLNKLWKNYKLSIIQYKLCKYNNTSNGIRI